MKSLYKPKMKYELSIRLTQKVCVNWTLHLLKKKVWTELWAYKKRKCELNIWLTQRESVDWTNIVLTCIHRESVKMHWSVNWIFHKKCVYEHWTMERERVGWKLDLLLFSVNKILDLPREGVLGGLKKSHFGL